MIQHHKWSLTEIEEMMPWERDVYVTLLNEHIKEENERIQKEQSQLKRIPMHLAASIRALVRLVMSSRFM